VGDADGSHEQKSTFVDNPLGLTEPLRTALVCVILVADNVVAEGAPPAAAVVKLTQLPFLEPAELDDLTQ
jgi:hypothetical protein